MTKQKLRLADLETLSKENAERREATLYALASLPRNASAKDIDRVAEGYPPLMEEIKVAGARVLTASLRLPIVSMPELHARVMERRARGAKTAEAVREIVRTVEVGAHVRRVLDTMWINGKLLGDCTKRELLLDAEHDTRRAETLADSAAWKQALAKILEPNQTVRTADAAAVNAVLQAVTT